MQSLEPKDPSEAYAVEFKFDRVLSSITVASCTVSLLSGTDASYTDLLNGSAQISGTSVYQRIKSGATGCTYKLQCEASDGTETYILTASIGVVTK